MEEIINKLIKLIEKIKYLSKDSNKEEFIKKFFKDSIWYVQNKDKLPTIIKFDDEIKEFFERHKMPFLDMWKMTCKFVTGDDHFKKFCENSFMDRIIHFLNSTNKTDKVESYLKQINAVQKLYNDSYKFLNSISKKDYIGESGYQRYPKPYNEPLRNENYNHENIDNIKSFINIFNQQETPKTTDEIILYRCVAVSDEPNSILTTKQLKQNYTEKGFLSTSTQFYSSFCNGSDAEKKDTHKTTIMCKIIVPKDTSCIFLDYDGNLIVDYEVLFPPGTSLIYETEKEISYEYDMFEILAQQGVDTVRLSEPTEIRKMTMFTYSLIPVKKEYTDSLIAYLSK